METREIDAQKNLYEITDPDELKQYIRVILDEVSKFHPSYPIYGYTYNNGQLVSVRKADGKIMT